MGLNVRSIRCVLLFLCALLSAGLGQHIQAETLTVGDTTEQYLLAERLDVFFDSTGEKTLDDVQKLDNKNWQHVDQTQFGFLKDTVWFRITIDVTQSRQEWSITESTTIFDHIKVYAPESHGYSAKDYGLLSGNERPNGHRVIKIPVERSGNASTFYFAISSSTPISPMFKLVNEQGFAKNNMLESYSLGAYYGMAIVIFILHLCIGLLLRDKNSLIFCAYVLSFAILGSYLQGIHYQLFSTGLTVNDFGLNLESPATTFYWVLFAATFSFVALAQRLLQNKNSKFDHYFFRTIYAVSLILLVPQLVVKSEMLLLPFNVWKMVTLVAILCLALYKGISEKNHAALYFAMGTLFPVTGLIIYSGVTFGLIGANLFTMYAGHYMTVGEYTFISLAMGLRLRKVNRAYQETLSRNVVELTEAKNEADKANAAKDVFLASVSHELKTPLNVISGTLQIIEETPLKGLQSSMVSLCADQSRFLEKLVNDILDMSSIERGKFSFVPAVCDPFEVIEKVVQGYEGEARRKGLALTYLKSNGAGDMARGINTDAFRLRQLAVNLVSNAIKFTNKGAIKIFLHSECASEANAVRFVLTVKDTGIGIAQEQQEVIFGEFSRILGCDKELNHNGVGLGLAIVSNIATLFDGKISVNSEHGVGSSFSFEFTAERSLNAGGLKEPILKPENFLVDGKESILDILLVEDNVSNRMVFQGILDLKNIPFISASSVDEAIDVLKEQTFDLIFIDIAMPERTGYELADYIRNENNDYDTCLVAVTADTRTSTKKKCKAAQFNDFIEKPIRKHLLYQKINDLSKAKKMAKDVIAEYSAEWIES